MKLFFNFHETHDNRAQQPQKTAVNTTPFLKTDSGDVIKIKINLAVEQGFAKMKLFGLTILDEYGTKNAIQEAFISLAKKFPNVDGRFFVKLDVPHSVLRQIVAREWERKRSGEGKPMLVREPFWAIDRKGSVVEAELNGDLRVEACLVPFNARAAKHEGDPILFGLDLPFDTYANDRYHDGNYVTTQKEVADQIVADYAKLGLRTGDQNDFLWMWLDDCRDCHTKVVDTQTPFFLLNEGYARIPNISRKTIRESSRIGSVYSSLGAPALGCSTGSALSDCGVFFCATAEVDTEA